jgi:hypothetical protein
MKQKGADMKDAIDLKAMNADFPPRLEIPQIEAFPQPTLVSPETASLLLERVAEIYAKRFTEAPEGRACLARHGLANAALLDRHRLGYADGTLADLIPKDGPLKDELKSLGILLDNGQERFLGCVVYPVYNQDGHLVTITGHIAGDGPLQHRLLPGRPMGLWNGAAVKTYPEIILAPSPLDGLSVMQSGHANVTALSGIVGLGDSRLDIFKKHGVQKVLLLAGDKDAASTSRLEQQLVIEGLHVTVRMLPEGHDPNSFLMEHGPRKLAAFLAVPDTPPPSTGHAPTRPGDRVALTFGPRHYEIWDPDKGTRRLKATIRIEQAGKLHVDTLDLYSARSRRSLAQNLCRIFTETPETIEAEIDKLLRHCETLPLPQHRESAGQPLAAPLLPEERSEAEAFGRRDVLFEEILSDFEACGLVGEKANKLLCYLATASRKLDEPLSVLILSSSGAGKTILQDTALTFCPPEDLVKLTSLSAKALFYKETLSLKHKVLALEEDAGAEEASYGIRNLITARELIIETAVKNPATGKITTMTNKVEGPTAVFLTTTEPDTDQETRSRFFVLSIDESREQTQAILSFQRRRQTLDGLVEQAANNRILRKHRNFQRLLRPLKVVNPFAESLGYGNDRLQDRRDQPKYLNLIKAVAFLRQMRKPVKTAQNGEEYLEVDLADIHFANELANELLGKCLDELSAPGRDLLLQTEALVKAKTQKRLQEDESASIASTTFTRREVREFTGWANARVHRYLKELCDLEYLLVLSGRNGRSYRYRLAWDGTGKDGSRFQHRPARLDPLDMDKENP